MRSPDFGIVAGLAILVLLCASLPYMSICARIVISVTFQKVDHAPDAKTGSEGNDEGLQHIDCAIEEIHILCAGIVSFWFFVVETAKPE